MKLTVRQTGELQGELKVPGDKSISHRAAILGALAKGDTVVTGFSPAADCRSTVDCLAALGVLSKTEGDVLLVKGGAGELFEPGDVLNAGNSGTTARLLLGVLAGKGVFAVMTGDSSLRRRPMGRVIKPLRMMGAEFAGRERGDKLPLAVLKGGERAIAYQTPVASAQIKSAILLAGLALPGETVVLEPARSRDHTERMLRAFGAEVRIAGREVAVRGGCTLYGQEVEVPGDISGAAFFLVAGACLANPELVVRNVGINPTRSGVLDVLVSMGARVEICRERTVAGEPVADLVVRRSRLVGTSIRGELIPRLIDEIPILAVAAAVADGETVIADAGELRVKESDRIGALVRELGAMGVDVRERQDGLIIRGGSSLRGAVCHPQGDHRMAMAMAVAGLLATGETVIEEADCADVSFPGFADILANITGGAASLSFP